MNTATKPRHELAIHAAAGDWSSPLTCDCGTECATVADFHAHTVRTWNNPDEAAIRHRGDSVLHLVPFAAAPSAAIVECTKVACYNHGNGRECFTLRFEEGGALFELTAEQAEQLREKGGWISSTHIHSMC